MSLRANMMEECSEQAEDSLASVDRSSMRTKARIRFSQPPDSPVPARATPEVGHLT
jgi:hypothetical protein